MQGRLRPYVRLVVAVVTVGCGQPAQPGDGGGGRGVLRGQCLSQSEIIGNTQSWAASSHVFIYNEVRVLLLLLTCDLQTRICGCALNCTL